MVTSSGDLTHGAAEIFGRFRLDELIGHGGMGEVYRAFDTRKQRVVAVKRLRAALAADDEFRSRFRRESAIVARISAPHVIPIHDFGDVDGRMFIEMELVMGPDLATRIAADGPLPPAVAVRIVTQVAAALEAAHADGLVHRDVKPSNVLLAGKDHDFAYLVDFGLARTVMGDSTAHTAAGATVGTVAYMAPERFLDGAADHRADVYSLACVLHEALTGEKPYAADDLPSMMYAHLALAPPRPSEHRPGVPAALDAVVARGMAKKPDDRYGSAAELAVAAVAALSGEEAPSTADAPTVRTTLPAQTAGPAAPTGGRWTRRAQVCAVGTALAAVLLVVAGIVLLPGAGPTPAPPARSTGPTLVAALNVGSNPGGPKISPDGGHVYVVTDNGVSSIDTRTSEVRNFTIAPRSRGQGSAEAADLAISPDGGLLYVATSASDRRSEVIAVVDTASGETRRSLPLGGLGAVTRDLTVSPDGRSISAAVVETNGPMRSTYKVIDTVSGALVRSLPLGDGYADARLVPPGARAYSVRSGDQRSSALAAVDLSTGTIGPPITVGDNPCTLAISRVGGVAYVSIDAGVGVVDTATDTVRRTIAVQQQTCGMALAPDERSLHFTTRTGLSVIDIDSGDVTETVGHLFARQAGSVAVAPDGHRVYVNDPAAATVLVIEIPAGWASR